MAGNDQLNESKLQTVLGPEARPSHPDELKSLTGAGGGSIGPIGLNAQSPAAQGFRIIADTRLKAANNLISGANKDDYHIMNIDLERDVAIEGYYDLRTVQKGEPCTICGKPLRVVKAIELGHIFKLGTKYADALKAFFLDETGKESPIIMGSYGIGLDRILACHIEQSHDNSGMIWSKALAPFDAHLILVSSKSEQVVAVSEDLFSRLQLAGIEILYDDRKDVSPGFKFKDADLLGIPLQIIVGEKNVVNGKVEVKERRTGERQLLDVENVLSYVQRYLE
jgi:prolyl-tRNA synthetase